MPAAQKRTKKLFIRLSSLGDVVLAMSALEVRSESAATENIDWVIAKEFAVLLEGHPRLRKVWSFDRRLGLREWKELGRRLWNEGYDEIYDLHATLRTKLMRALFLYWSLVEGRPFPAWRTISKRRFRLYFYFLFKSRWPKNLRPDSVTARSARLVGGTGSEKPSARHLVTSTHTDSPALAALLEGLKGKSYVCVMPGSKWAGKKWPVENFAELLAGIPRIPVIMGTPSDSESLHLMQRLKEMGVPAVSAVGAWSLRDVARILSGAWRYVGNDTGLGHLAEAVGVPSFVIFGPTREDMGFGPWRPESRSIGRSLVCRPCGKDGQFCYRLNDRFACLSGLQAKDVFAQIPEVMLKNSEIHG